MNKEPLGIAIAGLGFGQSVHLPAAISTELFNINSLWHPNPEKLDLISKKQSIKGVSDWSRLLEDKDIKGIIIATPPGPRFQLAKEALMAGKHLLLEKPVALNAAEIIKLETLALENSLTVGVNFEYRAVPAFRQAKRLLDKQNIGEPWLVKFDWIMGSRANKEREWNWYSDRCQGGGVIGALGTHAIDIIHWFFGTTRNVNSRLSTSIKQRFYKDKGELKAVSSEDVCLAQLDVHNYLTGGQFPTQLNLSSISRNGRGCWIEIYGSEGTIVLGSDNQKDYVHGFSLWFAPKGEELKNVQIDSDLAFKTTWKDGRLAPVKTIQELWHYSIKNSVPMIPGLIEAIESQKVCDLLIESNESGSRKSP